MKFNRRSFLFGTSLLAINTALAGAVMVAPRPAYAACTTINSNTTISDSSVSCITWNGGNISITGSGVVASTVTGIYNTGANVGTLSNAGAITTYLYSAVRNNGTIALIENNAGGTIDAILSQGTIGTIINSALVNGGYYGGIELAGGTIGTIENNAGGTINGATGVAVLGGSLGTIINSGTIGGGYQGISNWTTIGTIINSGLILGTRAINSTGSIGTILSTGTIAGSIINTGNLSITGGSGSTIGTLTGFTAGTQGTITNTSGNVVLSANLLLNDAINVGSGTVTNNGGSLSLTSIVSITGNYSQASGTLTEASGTELIVSGIADVTGGTIATAVSATGNYLAGGSGGTLVQGGAGSSYSGISIIGGPTGLTLSSSISNNALVLTFANDYIGGSLASLTNSGSIGGVGTALYIAATGSLGALSNTGTLSSSIAGINNNGSIDTLSNSGSVNGGNTGINNASSISTLGNTGTISGGNVGVDNAGGTIGTITNAGNISAGNAAINSWGTIGAIINTGTISGAYNGIINYNSIGTIANSGAISVGNSGIYNTQTIDKIINTGTLSGGFEGINNAGGTLGTIINSGVIEGPTAIHSQSSGGGALGTILSALSNAGTIAGMINVVQALTITGGSAGTLGTLTGYNGTIGTITTNTNDLTFDANAYQLLDDDINVGASHTVFNNGLIRVNTTHSITGNYSQGAGGTLVVGVTDSTHYGELIVSGAATLTGGHVLIVPTSGSLTNGETLTIVQAAAAGTSYSGVVATANGFTATTSSITAGGFEDLIISLSPVTSDGSGNTNNTYMQTGAVAGSNATSVGVALDQIQTNIARGGNASFAPILTALNTIGAQQGNAAEGTAIKQLGPGQLAPHVFSSTTLVDQGAGVIAQHLHTFLSENGGGATGRSAGSEYHSGIFWGQVSGGLANGTEGSSVGGYGENSYGLTAGTDFQVGRTASLGVALAWLHSNAWGTGGLSGSDLLTNSFQLTGYGSKRFGVAFMDGMLGLGYNRFDQNRAIGFLGTSASASYGGMQYMGHAEAGWDIPLSSRVTFTPVAGFEATRMANNAYTESGAGAADLSVSRQIIDSYATTLGFRAATVVPTVLGPVQPQIKLGWIHDLTNSAISTNGSLDGVSFTTATPRVAADGAQTGLAVSLQAKDDLTLSASYNLEARQGFLSNDGFLKAALKF